MDPVTEFIPDLSFAKLAASDAALRSFQNLLQQMAAANWRVIKAEETTQAGKSGLLLSLLPAS